MDKVNEILANYDKEEINKANELLEQYSNDIDKKEEKQTDEIYQQLLKDVFPSIDVVGIMKKSIAEGAEAKLERDKKYKKMKTKWYVKSVAVILAMVGALAIAPGIYSEMSYHYYEKQVIEIASRDAGLKLSQSGLYVVPDPMSKEWRNDYSKIEDLSEKDLFGMLAYLGKEESEKVVQALGYTGWDNYLSMNGYFDESGNPSITVFRNMTESELVEEYREGKEDGKRY